MTTKTSRASLRLKIARSEGGLVFASVAGYIAGLDVLGAGLISAAAGISLSGSV